MPDVDLAPLDALAAEWAKYVAGHPAPDDFGRVGGYIAGLEVCARQLAETLERIRADA